MIKEIQSAGEKAQSMFFTKNWALWRHEGIPDEPEWLRTSLRAIAAIKHCLKCTVLSGCYFVDEIPKKCPEHPLHEKCDCVKTQSIAPSAVAHCDLAKFIGYIFSEKYAKNGKGKLFEALGFTKEDSEMLRNEYERQAKEKYLLGDYFLGMLDHNGQRMNIDIEFSHPQRGRVVFTSGWMIRPKGYITCNTPLGG